MPSTTFSKANQTGFVLCVALVATLTGCVGYAGRSHPRSGYMVRTEVSAPVVVVQDDYVYYPSYQMYYGSRSRQYYYQDGSSWVARPAPQGIAVNVLLASPSVTMDFHDRPERHHAQVVQTYPRTWTRSDGNHGRKNDRRKESKGDDKDDHRR